MSERAQLLLSLADDELILGWRDSEWTGDRADARGGRRVLVDRPERDRPRARALRARRGRARHRRGRARVRPRARRLPLRAVRRAAAARRLGAHDRAPLPLRGGRPAAASTPCGAATTPSSRGSRRRSTARRSTTACTPRCGQPACMTSRASARRSRSCGRSRSGPRADLRAELARRVGRDGRSQQSVATRSAASTRRELAELWEQMTEVRRTRRGRMVTAEQVWAALEEIPDPEIPVISLVDLGVIRDVRSTASMCASS